MIKSKYDIGLNWLQQNMLSIRYGIIRKIFQNRNDLVWRKEEQRGLKVKKEYERWCGGSNGSSMVWGPYYLLGSDEKQVGKNGDKIMKSLGWYIICLVNV